MIDVPAGRHLGGCYVTIGYSNAGAVADLERATEIVDGASVDLPFRTDLAQATRLLRRVGGQLVGIADDE
jgi:small-conductance mechanosensitive channel